MERFHIINDGVVILRVNGGTFRQSKIFRRGEHVYAEAGSNSFIRLLRSGGTTNPKVAWLELEGPGVSVTNGLPKWEQPAARALAPKRSKTKLVAVG